MESSEYNNISENQVSLDAAIPKENKRLRFLDRLNSNNPRLNRNLFLATCVTTFLTGWLQDGNPLSGLWYGGAIIAILFAHEMGHYLMCRKYGIKATLPFFIPFPPGLSPFGTLGAVIKMESQIPSRRALFDVAVAGPLAGLVFAIPAIYFGLQFSTVVDASPQSYITLGEPLLFAQLSQLAIGTLPAGKDVLLHPLAYAGWAGLFVTALNLMPIGQLDGGHVIYAILGPRHRWVAKGALILFAFLALFVYIGWIVLLFMLIWMGHRHPPTLDDRPIDGRRMLLGAFMMVIFVFSFTPVPLGESIGMLPYLRSLIP